jgi:hypothetical protein
MTAREPGPGQHQAQRVLSRLRQAFPGGSCLKDFGEEAYTARNRVGDLRKLGWIIDADICHEHRHSGRVARYYLRNPDGTQEGMDGRLREESDHTPHKVRYGVAAAALTAVAPLPIHPSTEEIRRAAKVLRKARRGVQIPAAAVEMCLPLGSAWDGSGMEGAGGL